MKKWVSLILAVLMIAVMLPSASAGSLEGPLTSRFLYHSLQELMLSQGNTYDNNRIINYHREHSGIDMQMEPALVNGTEESQKKAMILASGNVPDLMLFSNTEYFQYALDGVLLPTDAYLENMPNYMAMVPEAAREICRVDGVLYAFPGSHEEAEMFGGDGILVRKDVYDTLGIEKEPQTVEEYYEMWKAVKEKTDMMPIISSNFNTMKAAFGVLSDAVEKEGALVFTWAQPEFKEYLAYMAKLYAEGLLEQEYVTSNTASNQEKFYINGTAFSKDAGWADGVATINKTLTPVEGGVWEYLPQMTKDAETPAQLTKVFPSQRINAIPAGAKNPELAAKWIEYMCTPEAKMAQDYGIEGVDYTLDAEGKVQQTRDEQNDIGWKICYEFIPTPASFQVRLFAKGFDPFFYGLLAQREASNVVGVENPLTFLPPSEEYLNLQTQLGLKAYSDEQANKFIMGERSIDDFDKYLAELEQRGLSRLETALNEWAASVQ